MRKSFIIHFDSLEVLADLSDEQAGQLLKAMWLYQTTGEESLNGIMKAVFTPFKNQFIRDNEKYLKICERNKENGKNGGRPKEPKETQSDILGLKETQSNPEKPDNKNKNKNKNDSKKENNRVGINDLSVIHIKDWLDEKRVSGKYLTVDEDALLEKFRNYCISKGRTYKDYVAAFRNAFEWDNPPKRKIKTDNDDMALQKKILRGEI